MLETQSLGDHSSNIVVIIPAYQPGDALLQVIADLPAVGLGCIVVIDDGSGPAYAGLFRQVAQFDHVHLLRHAVNLGKGAALKTGINFALCEFPEAIGFVTVDADGQHRPEDAARVARKLQFCSDSLILGSRAFEGKVPLRSRFGNSLTRYVMKAVVGASIHDTQTGLRAIPASFARDLLKLTSTGYEFELDMLITARQMKVPIEQVPIQTVYEEGNKSSHFNPLTDSMKIYFVLLRFCSVSLASSVLDNLVFIAAFHAWHRIGPAQILSRCISLAFVYVFVRRAVFYTKRGHDVTLPRFLALAAVSGTVSYTCIRMLVANTAIPVLWAKILVESIIFFANFAVQRDLIFDQAVEPAGPAPVEEIPPEEQRRRRWQRIVLWAVFLISAATLVYGFGVTGISHERVWTRDAYHRVVAMSAFFGVGCLIFCAFARRWLLPFTSLAAIVLTVISVGIGPVLTLAIFFVSCVVLARGLFSRDLPAPLAYLCGISLWACAMAPAARLPIHYSVLYVGIEAGILLIWRRETVRLLRQIVDAWRTGSSKKLAPFVALCAVIFIIAAHWLIVLEPESSFDGLTAHLAISAQLAKHHALTSDFHHYVWSTMPMFGDMIYAIVYSPGGEFAARLLDLSLLITILAIIYRESKRVISPSLALLLCALFASLPLTQLVTGALYVENFTAAMLLAGVAAVAFYREHPGTRLFLMTAFFLGSCGGYKVAALALACVLFVMLIAQAMRHSNHLRRPHVAVYLVALLLFLVPALWSYGYSYVETGDPVFPYSAGIFKSPYVDHPIRDPRFREPLSFSMPYHLTFQTHRFMEGQDGAFGFHLLLLVPLALASLFFVRDWMLRSSLLLGMGGALMIGATLPNARYFYPVMPMLTLGVAAAFAALRRIDRNLLVAVCGASMVALFLNLYFIHTADWMHRDFFTPPLFSARGRSEYVEERVPIRNVIRYLNDTDRGNPVLFAVEPFRSDLIAPSYSNDWHDTQFLHDATSQRTPQDVYRLLQSLKISHIVTELPIPQEQVGPNLTQVLQTCGQPEFVDRNEASLKLASDCTQRLDRQNYLMATGLKK